MRGRVLNSQCNAIRNDLTESDLTRENLPRLIQEQRPTKGVTSLVSIGYEGRSIETYLTLLTRVGVTVLCDVRRNAISRKRGFSKSALAKGCGDVGIRYEHLPALGISSDRRRGLKTSEDYQRLLAEYDSVDLPQRKEELAQVQSWISSGEIVALTCFERDPEYCHRGRVAAAIERLPTLRAAAEHL